MKQQIKRILLTGSGAPGWVPIFRCIMANKNQAFQIYGCDIKEETAGAYYAKKHFAVPPGDDPKYIKTILNICVTNKIDAILPITDAELIPLSRSLDIFEKHQIRVPISSTSSLEVAMHKVKLFDYLKEKRLGVCKYYIAHSLEEFQKAIKNLGYPRKPICLKPAVAWGSRGFRVVDPKINLYDIFLKEKPNTTFTNLNSIVETLQEAKSFPQLLVMEYLPGKEYTVDILIQDKKIKCVVPRLRLRMNNGITTEGLVEENNEIIELSRKIVTSLRLDYSVGIQFKYDSKNNPKVLEINPRLQGTTVISYGAGVNIPYFTLLALENKPIPRRKIHYGTHLFRHWEEIFVRDNKKLHIY